MPRRLTLLDTVRHVETPEGVDIEIRVAGPVARALAWAVDLALRAVGYGLVSPVLLALGEPGIGLLLILVFVAEWFYPVLFEVLRHGQTPGKMVLGLVVVHDDGTPVGWTASITRNLLRTADFLPFGWLFGLVSMSLSRDFKRLGDLAAGTVVAWRGSLRESPPLPTVTPEPTPGPLELGEQRAIIAFAERSPTWTAERQQELAGVLAPVLGGSESAAAGRLHGMARWLTGAR